MQNVRVLILPVMLFGCNRASWGPKSGWETYNDPDAPDFEGQGAQTQGSYTPVQASEPREDED